MDFAQNRMVRISKKEWESGYINIDYLEFSVKMKIAGEIIGRFRGKNIEYDAVFYEDNIDNDLAISIVNKPNSLSRYRMDILYNGEKIAVGSFNFRVKGFSDDDVMIKISNEVLYEYENIQDVLNIIGYDIQDVKPNRIDLALDIKGYSSMLDMEYISTLKKVTSIHGLENGKVDTYYLSTKKGKADSSLVIYDKLKEIRGSSAKWYIAKRIESYEEGFIRIEGRFTSKYFIKNKENRERYKFNEIDIVSEWEKLVKRKGIEIEITGRKKLIKRAQHKKDRKERMSDSAMRLLISKELIRVVTCIDDLEIDFEIMSLLDRVCKFERMHTQRERELRLIEDRDMIGYCQVRIERMLAAGQYDYETLRMIKEVFNKYIDYSLGFIDIDKVEQYVERSIEQFYMNDV